MKMTEDTKDHFWVGKFSRIPRNMDFNKIPELKEKAEDFLINPKIFFRHAGIFGSTGSGKTVLGKIICEEAARHGIPIIAIDPQGDIAALKLIGDKQKVMAQGVPGDVFDNYKNTINVKIFTPSSQKGLPISINPINIPDKGDEIEQEDVIKLLDNQAKILVTILIKIANLSARYKSSVEAAIYKVLDGYYRKGEKIETLIELANIIEENTDPDIGIDVFLDEKLRKKLSTVLKTLTVGSTKLLFSGEDNIDIGKLLTPEKDGKTKVNIFFLKSLYSQEEKEFFISVLANELYSWMLRQGQAKKPRCIFFCDEIAPFIPAGSAKPGPKEPLILLFRQARKYGIQCFIATQSPKDVDYHAYEQFNTFFIGRVTSQQSLKVIEKILEGFPDDGTIQESIESIPVLKSGQFLFISPDNPIPFAMLFTRWLISRHQTLTLDDVRKILEDEIARMKLEEELRRQEEEERKRREEEERRRKEEVERKAREEEERRRKEEVERKAREEEERLRKEEAERKAREEEERRRKEEAERKAREEEERNRREEIKKIEKERAKIAKMSDKQLKNEIEQNVFGVDEIFPIDLTYRMIMDKIFERLKKVAKSDHGTNFLKDLVEKRKLPDEISKMTYYQEWKIVKKVNMAYSKGEDLIFDFKSMMVEIFKELGLKAEEIQKVPLPKVEAIFYKLLFVEDLKDFLK